ncbi:MAG: sugar ABC transporter ATP-binding protein, partial [Caldilinea sp.]
MTTTTDGEALLSAQGVYMAFDGVDVLRNASLDLFPGEVHSILGENGAGKSTLLKIMAGIYPPRRGQLLLDGAPVVVPNPYAAMGMGIAVIPQEPLAFPDLTVAENIFVGVEPTQGAFRFLDWKSIYRRAGDLLGTLGLHLNPRASMRGLSVADQQMVNMAAALAQNARVLLMDEPTAAITPNEVERLFAIVRRLRQQGTAIAFISHRLEEIFAISDRITILRDGEVVGERFPERTTHDELIRLMVGRSVELMTEKTVASAPGAVRLSVRNLSARGRFSDISFDLRAGEIVGMAGLVGAGRSHVAEAIFGIASVDDGLIEIDGRPVVVDSPRTAMAHRIALVPEDRQHMGKLMPMSVADNATLPTLPEVASLGWLRPKRERERSQAYVEQLRIVLRRLDQPVAELSGGNQQKVVLSKWLMR